MSDFVQTMKDWRRMCQAYRNQCDLCPLASYECGAVPRNMKYFTDKQVEGIIMSWAAEHPVVYPTVYEWLVSIGLLGSDMWSVSDLNKPIPADIAQKLGIEPKMDGDADGKA